MAIHAWIFDLGKTLMEIPDEFDEESCLAEILGYEDSEQVRSIIYRLCDKYPKQSAEDFLQRFDKIVNPKRDGNLSSRIETAWLKSVQQAQLIPGAREILDDLRSLDMKIALISNTPPTSHYILDRLKLRKRFDVIAFSCDVGYLKPDPRIFEAVLRQLRELPQNTVVVGDKIRTDILGGAILGLKSILVEKRLRCVVENAQNYVDAIIPHLHYLRNTKFYKQIKKSK